MNRFTIDTEGHALLAHRSAAKVGRDRPSTDVTEHVLPI